MNAKQVRLNEILKNMDVPELRKSDFSWLLRNLGIRNANNENFSEAISLIQDLVNQST